MVVHALLLWQRFSCHASLLAAVAVGEHPAGAVRGAAGAG
jgi:hypothetical protein